MEQIMNRAERKRQERALKKSEVKYSLEEMRAFVLKEVAKMQHEIEVTARKYAIRDLSACFIDALYLQHDFGKKRIYRLFSRINDIFNSINKGEITIDEVIKSVEEDVKIDFNLMFQDDEYEVKK